MTRYKDVIFRETQIWKQSAIETITLVSVRLADEWESWAHPWTSMVAIETVTFQRLTVFCFIFSGEADSGAGGDCSNLSVRQFVPPRLEHWRSECPIVCKYTIHTLYTYCYIVYIYIYIYIYIIDGQYCNTLDAMHASRYRHQVLSLRVTAIVLPHSAPLKIIQQGGAGDLYSTQGPHRYDRSNAFVGRTATVIEEMP